MQSKNSEHYKNSNAHIDLANFAGNVIPGASSPQSQKNSQFEDINSIENESSQEEIHQKIADDSNLNDPEVKSQARKKSKNSENLDPQPKEDFSPHPPSTQPCSIIIDNFGAPSNKTIQPKQSYSKKAPRNKPRSARNPSKNNLKDEISPLSKQFLLGEPISEKDPNLIAASVRELEDYRDVLMINGSYQESNNAQRAVEDAKAAQIKVLKTQQQEAQLSDIRKRQSQIQKKYQEFNKNMDQREEELNQILEQQMDELYEKHDKELQKHDEEWNSETKSRQFNRSSQKLRVLRTQQQLLLNAKRFEEANIVRQEADRLQAYESSEAEKSYRRAFLNSRANLEKKQSSEVELCEQTAECRKQEFKHFRERASLPYVRQLRAIDIQETEAKDPDKLWIRKHRNDGDPLQSAVGSRSQKNPMTRSVRVREFNKLSLAPLPSLSTVSKRINRENHSSKSPRRSSSISNIEDPVVHARRVHNNSKQANSTNSTKNRNTNKT